MADFDPYYQWLAIPPKDQPPNHYRLLGVELLESNTDVISNAADQRMTHVRSFQTGKYSALSQKLLNEIAAAKICLLNPAKKDSYDRQFRQESAPPPATSTAPSPANAQLADDLAFLAAPILTPRAIPLAKHKQSADKGLNWLGLGLLGGAAVLLLALIAAVLVSRGGKEEVASTNESSPIPAPPTVKKPVSPKPAGDLVGPGKHAEPPASTADDPHGKAVVKPAAAAGNSTIVNPKNTAVKPTKASGAAGILRSFPEDETKEDDPKEEETKARSPERDHEKVESEAPNNPMPPNETTQPSDTVAPPAEKAAVPDEAAQKRALAIIRETYKEDYRASDKAALAKKLVATADDSKDDATARFVLLQEAKKVAVEAFLGELAFEVIDTMASEYEVCGSEMKAEVLDQAVKKMRSPQQQKAFAQAALEVMNDAIAEDKIEIAKRVRAQALPMARQIKDKVLIQDISAKGKEVEAAAKAYAEIEAALAMLREKPNDPDANLTVGKHLCCKGRWEKALPMLALGSDAALKALAERDIQGASTPEEQVKLADGWWSIGHEAKGEWRGAVLLHAGTWYQQAQPNLATTLVKSLVEKRLETIAALGREIPTVSGKPPPLALAPFNEKSARQHQARWARYLGKPVVQTNSIGMKLVLIPPGEFMMGSPRELIEEEFRLRGNSDLLAGEGPQHRVRITKPYWLGMTVVTQEEYQRVMHANPSRFQGFPTRPVEQVTWDDAVEFCRRLSELPGEKAAGRRYGLPTEAQWEHACRAGNMGRWYFSAQSNPYPAALEEKLLGEYAWINTNAGGQTHPVGQKRPNAWGLYDMYGNVWQCCRDWYDKDYYAKSAMDDPVGPPGGLSHVLRGGHWPVDAWSCRSATRGFCGPAERGADLSLRVSLVPTDRLVKQPTDARQD